MSSRGAAKYRSNYGRGGTSRGSLTSTRQGRSASPGGNELPPGDLVVRLHAADISPSGGPARISNFQCIASYNWLDSSAPIILVPGISGPCYQSILTEERLLTFHDAKALLRFGPLQLIVEGLNQTKAKYSSIKMLHVTLRSHWSQCFAPYTRCILSTI